MELDIQNNQIEIQLHILYIAAGVVILCHSTSCINRSMPATNYNWAIKDQPAIFQVYGTKRKNCAGESSQDIVEEVETKRRCTETRVGVEEEMTDSMEIMAQTEFHPCQSPTVAQSSQMSYSHSVSSLQPSPPHLHHHQPAMNSNAGIHLALHHLQVNMNNRVPPLPDVTGDHHIDNNNTQTVASHQINNNLISQAESQSNMIMDLNDELYSKASLPLNPQTDAEYEAACNVTATMEGDGEPNPQQYSVAYCDQQCVGGDTSPFSGNVRCLCRPSWEGLIDTRHYVSDYY